MTSTADEVHRYTTLFKREHLHAQQEYIRLNELLKDALWYNFEISCKTWKPPWKPSDLDSWVYLEGHRYMRRWANHKGLEGVWIEEARYPIWHEGPVRTAPALPIQIVLEEQRAAKLYLDACEQQCTAAHDWAPGGALYEQLRKTTLVGRFPDVCAA